ncbi:dTMP kinase [Micromonospora peucetia]|uniref:Thymidylate kinase n=1 Tax=Micromonospora peucetia TaxID=47871 RepID=A0A1C6W4T5_9ACTN|nr:dTMP kinase [Micromonospora peucetia]SCL73595.1 dTMP kinase [Micromonospora peucetia]
MITLFIAIEGPNGVGKSTTSRLLADRLADLGPAGVHLTAEPTRTPLGQLLRRQEDFLHGKALALALAADRAAHIENEIVPRLDDGFHVVTDRYVASSLVLQRVDGLDLAEIWSYNRYVLPATVIYLEDDPDVIRARLAARAHLTRLERAGSPEKELVLHRDAARHLHRQEWRQYTIACAGLTPDQIVSTILNLLPADTLLTSEA